MRLDDLFSVDRAVLAAFALTGPAGERAPFTYAAIVARLRELGVDPGHGNALAAVIDRLTLAGHLTTQVVQDAPAKRPLIPRRTFRPVATYAYMLSPTGREAVRLSATLWSDIAGRLTKALA